MASQTGVGNDFAAPSTASFGESNEENHEEMTARHHVLVPALVASYNTPSGCRPAQADQEESFQSPARNMADMIGNTAASADSTPMSYEMVTMSPDKEAKETQAEEKNDPKAS